jgi:hypothetical protein
MARRIFCTLVVAGLLMGKAGAEAGHNDGGADTRAVRAHQAFLADDLLRGRDTGSPEYEIAARYVASQLQALGLEPAGDGDSYLQSVPLLKNELETDSIRFSVTGPEDGFDLEWKEDFLIGGDAVRGETSITASVVFVGHGITAPDLDYDDYASIDVEGKIVLMVGGAPASFPHNQRAYYSSGTHKTPEAVGRGAVGVLSFVNAERAKKYPWERMTRNAGRPGLRWVDESGQASDFYPQIEGSAFLNHDSVARLLEGSEHTLEEILEAEATQTLKSFKLPIEVTISRKTGHEAITASNVAAILPGSDPELAKEYVLYSAHLDHVGVGAEVEGDEIYNGAYDNAMGVAVMLEAARMFASADTRPARSILFLAVTGEEKGLLGSEYFARFPTVSIENIVANINLDMPLLLYPMADVTAFGAEHSSLEGPVSRAAEKVGLTLTPDPMPEEVLFIRSDQYSFVREGVPAIFFVAGMQSSDPDIDGGAIMQDFLRNHYHMPSDDLSRPVDWDSTRRFTEANYLIGLEVANTPERPTWNEGDFFGERFGR